MGISNRAARMLAITFLTTTVALAVTLALVWVQASRLMESTAALTAPPVRTAEKASAGPISPLLLQYRLNLPGRGEIFPALAYAEVADYWPVAVLSISNTSDRPAVQRISAEVPGWSARAEQTVIIGPKETRTLRLNPDLLPDAFSNNEIRRAILRVQVSDPSGATSFAESRPVFLHSASDLYWGKSFANAQFIARWVTPHDDAVLRLISDSRRWVPGGRLAGYNMVRTSPDALAAQVRAQARAVFQALRGSRITYVSSIFTFGNFSADAQRIRFPHETLGLSSANCIDVSVAFASAMENLGMHPVIVIVPGHAFTGVRLGPEGQSVLYLDLTVLPRGSFEQAIARANHWMKKTPPEQVLTVDVSAARALGIFPMPVGNRQFPVASASKDAAPSTS